MITFFSAVLFISSFLLFLIQPLAARTLLPFLGGSAQVWTSCVLFFQLLLLAGYFYAHKLSKIPSLLGQIGIHLCFLALALITLYGKTSFSIIAPGENARPVLWLLKTLWENIGLPFFFLSASTPLFQSWFSKLDHAESKNPYFLTVAGNLGSAAGLLAYPFYVEPAWTLFAQFVFWSRGFMLFGGFVLVLTLLTQIRANKIKILSSFQEHPINPALPWSLKGKWMLYSFIPCSLMLGITTHLTTDVGPLPLIWVLTLAIYLLTFAAAFEPRVESVLPWIRKYFSLLLLPALAIFALRLKHPFGSIVFFESLFLLSICLYFHLKLAKSRPVPTKLTTFYFCISIGGLFGGILNGVVAPALFSSILEYPLIFLAAGFLWTLEERKLHAKWNRLDLLWALLFWVYIAVMPSVPLTVAKKPYAFYLIIMGLPFLIMALGQKRPVRFFLTLFAALFLWPALPAPHIFKIYQTRSFYGVHRIFMNTEKQVMVYQHGSTIHGAQSLVASKRKIPQTYYHPLGPLEPIVEYFRSLETRRDVAVIGLGTGSMAAYSAPDERWHFYEIDPKVKAMATDLRFFTYLEQSRAPFEIILGDGRLSLAAVPDGVFGMIAFDVFSSDSIPVHFLTKEAIQLYLRKLARPGVLAFHISNRYLNLRPVLSALADQLDLQCLYQDGPFLKENPAGEMVEPSSWMIMVPRKQGTRVLLKDSMWRIPSVSSDPRFRWTDDYSNVWSLFKKS